MNISGSTTRPCAVNEKTLARNSKENQRNRHQGIFSFTDLGGRAAAQVHYQVKADITKSDQRLVAQAFNKLFALVTLFNFGAAVPPPRFIFEQMEELHRD